MPVWNHNIKYVSRRLSDLPQTKCFLTNHEVVLMLLLFKIVQVKNHSEV